ncbi:MAG: tol-pal system YbgF family protein [Puniceicoccaceae bacterium]
MLLCLNTGLCCMGILPMRDQWKAAVGALASGHARVALEKFREFDHWYGRETPAREPVFRKKQLRLWGLAALQAGEQGEGLPLLLEWLQTTTEETPYRAFIRFQVGLACQIQGDGTSAASHWRAFLSEHPQLPETALVRWMWADQLLSEARLEEARRQLEKVIEEGLLSQSGRNLARAALALVCISMGDGSSAVAYLGHAGATDGPQGPADLWKALLAPALVQDLLHTEPELAQSASGWFDLPENLQKQVLPFIQAAHREAGNVRQAVWKNHWQAQLKRLQSAIEKASESGNGMEALFRLRLRSLLKGDRLEEGLYLSEFLLHSRIPAVGQLRADCHAAAIEACLKLALWDRADAFASTFIKEYPEDPGLPDILFLKARIAAERKDFMAAVEQVDGLLHARPDHSSVLAWQMTAAGWLLDGGEATTALDRYEALTAKVPRAWLPLIGLQRSRCLDKSGKAEAATSLLKQVTGDPLASSLLKEQAYMVWLGIAMRRLQVEEFQIVLNAYRQSFPDGFNRLMVENLAGTFASLTGDPLTAETLFTAVAGESHPAASYAHQQLSTLYRQKQEYPSLRKHARTWIGQTQRSGSPIPTIAMEDCRLYQIASGEPALDKTLLETLIEQMETGDPKLPGTAFLGLLEDQWDSYSTMLGQKGLNFAGWLEEKRNSFSMNENWLPYAHCLLFEADQLESCGRHDSADTRRIEVLNSVDPDMLDAGSLHTVATTADRYDFPEGVPLLEAFLKRFPEDKLRPDVLYRLACRCYRRFGERDRAKGLLAEILTHWADAAIHTEAGLLVAEWALEEGNFSRAASTLLGLLEKPGLPPALAAKAMLLRAQTDFGLNNEERGRLGCQRILALYPAFEEITATANTLLQQHNEETDANDA